MSTPFNPNYPDGNQQELQDYAEIRLIYPILAVFLKNVNNDTVLIFKHAFQKVLFL